MNRAILERGVNLIDTAEQYPIPSDRARPEGTTERIIGEWLAKDGVEPEKVVLSAKITGGANARNETSRGIWRGSAKVQDGLHRRVHAALAGEVHAAIELGTEFEYDSRLKTTRITEGRRALKKSPRRWAN